jgi:hypothetical protein
MMLTSSSVIRLLRRLGGPFDGRSRPGHREAKTLSGRGVFIACAASIGCALIAASHRFDDSAIGTAVGAAAVFGLLFSGLFIGCGMGWK